MLTYAILHPAVLRYVQKAASELRDQTLVTQMAVLIACAYVCARLDVTNPTVIDIQRRQPKHVLD